MLSARLGVVLHWQLAFSISEMSNAVFAVVRPARRALTMVVCG